MFVLRLDVRAFVISIGFWGLLIIIILQYTPNPILIIEAPVLGLRLPNLAVPLPSVLLFSSELDCAFLVCACGERNTDSFNRCVIP